MKRPPVWSSAEIERLRALHAEGLTSAQIAPLLGRSVVAVGAKLQKLGLTKPRHVVGRTAELIDDFRSGMSVQQMAEKYRCDSSAIYKRLKAAGVAGRRQYYRTPGVGYNTRELRILRQMHAAGALYADIGKAIGRTKRSVATMCARLGLRRSPSEIGDAVWKVRGRFWTPERDHILRHLYINGVETNDIAGALGCSRASARQRRHDLGVKRPNRFGSDEADVAALVAEARWMWRGALVRRIGALWVINGETFDRRQLIARLEYDERRKAA